MSRNGDSQGITWHQVGISSAIFVALVSAVVHLHGSVNAHNESELSHPHAEKDADQRIESHDSNKYAHPEMRELLEEKLKPIKADTAKILEALQTMPSVIQTE